MKTKKTKRNFNRKTFTLSLFFASFSLETTTTMLQTVTRRAQRALLLSRLVAGGKGAGGNGGSPRGAATDASASAPSATTPIPPTSATMPPPYSPPQKPASAHLREVHIPTLNFWQAPTRPSDWNVSQKYWFVGGVGALSIWATVKALSADNNSNKGRNGGNGAGERKVSSDVSPAKQGKALSADNNGDKGGGNGGNGASESKVSSDMSPAKQGMISEQERSPVKKQVP